MSAYATALALVLALEAGCVDNPADPGGLTCYGITQGVYDSYRSEHGLPTRPVTEITDAEVQTIYHTRYWVPSGAQEWAEAGHPGVAIYVFDVAVQHGIAGAQTLITEAIGDALRDHPLLGLALLHAKRMEYYTHLRRWQEFGRGWTRRIARVYREAMREEHTDGLLRVQKLNLNGTEWAIGIARIVRERIWVRGALIRRPPCKWWRRIIGRCSGA